MLYRYPSYYKGFQCVGSDCVASCCAGWEIVIDEESLDLYKQVEGNFGHRLKKSINHSESVFRQDDEKRCTFLNGENLCDIYSNLGEESLCHTCSTYPRHMEEFEDVKEMSLSLSCPEIAKTLLAQIKPISFYDEEVEEECEEFEEFDFLFFDILCNLRDYLVTVIQDRKINQLEGFLQLTKLIIEIQDVVDRDDIFETDTIIEKYKEKFTELKDQEPVYRDYNLRREAMQGCMSHLFDLEVLHEDWDESLTTWVSALYLNNELNYHMEYQEFQQSVNVEIELENIMVYFIYSYFCGAVYDGDILAKFYIALINTMLIEEMWFSTWLENDKILNNDSKEKIVYRFAREIEHSDLNLDTLESLYNTEAIYEPDKILKLFSVEE